MGSTRPHYQQQQKLVNFLLYPIISSVLEETQGNQLASVTESSSCINLLGGLRQPYQPFKMNTFSLKTSSVSNKADINMFIDN